MKYDYFCFYEDRLERGRLKRGRRGGVVVVAGEVHISDALWLMWFGVLVQLTCTQFFVFTLIIIAFTRTHMLAVNLSSFEKLLSTCICSIVADTPSWTRWKESLHKLVVCWTHNSLFSCSPTYVDTVNLATTKQVIFCDHVSVLLHKCRITFFLGGDENIAEDRMKL